MPWTSWPRWVRILIAIAIVIIVIILLALIISWAGGGDWHINLGRFHWDIGVTKGST